MGDLLDTGSAFLDRARGQWASRTVVYARGGDSVELGATVGRTQWEQTDQFGEIERSETRDFLVTAADLVLGGLAILPERGDRITEIADAGTRVHQVLAPGSGPPWQWADPYRRTLRIHTREVEAT